MSEGLFAVLTAFGGSLLFLMCSYGAGSFAGPWLAGEDPLMRGILFTALGFGIWVHGLILAGSLESLRIPVLGGCAVLAGILGTRRFAEFGEWLKTLWRHFFCGEKESRPFQILFGASALLTALLCLLPETANDALCYQLNLPKLFIRQGSIHPIPEDLNSYQPLFMNLLYGVGLFFKSVPLAKMLHWWTGILLFAALGTVVGRKTSNGRLACFFSLMLMLTPAFMNQMTTTYVDVAASFFVFLGFYLFINSGKVEKNAPLYFLSGLLFGFAVSTKFYVLAGLLPVGLLFLARLIRAPQRSKTLAGLWVWPAGLLAGYGFWFFRNLWLTGNPFYPYFGALFGTGGSSNFGNYWNYGVHKTLLQFVLFFPWSMTAMPNTFGPGHWIGPFFLLVFPLFILSLRRSENRPWAFFFFCMAAVNFFVGQNVRYLMPVFPVYLVAAAGGALTFYPQSAKPGLRRAARAAGLGLALFLFVLNLYHYRFQFLNLSGFWNKEQYLLKMERSIPMARWINRHLPENAKILNAEEVRQFYFDRPMVREIMLYRKENYSAGLGPGEMAAFLRKKGFTHVLRTQDLEHPGSSEGRLFVLDQVLANPREAKLLAALDSENIRERRFRYRLYELVTR